MVLALVGMSVFKWERVNMHRSNDLRRRMFIINKWKMEVEPEGEFFRLSPITDI
jgi:hypothetical protein